MKIEYQNQIPSHVDYQKLHEIFLTITKRRIRNAEDAEEIVQDALLTIVKKASKETFRQSFIQWAFGVLRNKIGNYYQKKDRHSNYQREVEEDDLRKNPDHSPDPYMLFQEVEAREKILDAWKKLSIQCRKLLGMLWQGHSREEIFAAFPQYNFKVVNTKIFRCRNYLKRLLRKEGYKI